MANKVEIDDFEPLLQIVNDMYDGNFIALCYDIDNAIYLFHYLEPDQLENAQLQNVCFTLKRLKECFYLAYQRKQSNCICAA